MKNLTRILTLVVAPALVVGCSGEPPRSPVSGRVTWKGQPVAQGNIRFQLADAPAVTGVIKDGQYRLEGKSRVYAGTARVEIEAFVEEGKVSIGAAQSPLPRFRQILPPQFNSKSTLRVEVKPGQENEHHFELKP